MNFTFGIITKFDINDQHSSEKKDMLAATIDSIRNLKIPNYEIIIVGCKKEDLIIGRYDYLFNMNDIKCIIFDDNYIKNIISNKQNSKQSYGIGFVIPGWITKKKNLITQNAKYENIVFMHDYHMFDRNWYKEFLKFGNDWHVCMNAIKNIFGERARDWVGWDENNASIHRKNLPYNFNDGSKVYISGSYWVAKKALMIKEPLDEKFLAWGKILKEDGTIEQCQDSKIIGEDVEWSKRIRDKYKIVLNYKSIVKHTRAKFTGDEKFHFRKGGNISSPTYEF
jgi:hypothetical protein